MTQIEPNELRALAERIISSGVLGRSKTYGAILQYLVECSINGDTPKEAAIAIDVLGREADFDVSRDSIVRVHIYNLRSKLETYFARSGKQEKYRINIPKGQYIITTIRNTAAESGDESSGQATGALSQAARLPYMPWILGVLVLLLVLNLLRMDIRAPEQESAAGDDVQQLQPWDAFLDDDLPILLVIGDYYIFGEVDNAGNVTRMVREFNINSPGDLNTYQEQYPEQGRHMFNLDLSYIPVSVAGAMARILPPLHAKADRISVIMESALETADLASSHIIYLGYLSGMDSLLDLMFADSGLSIGATFDELYNLETKEYYVGSSGLSGTDSFQDYGMVSTFQAPNGNQFLLVAGMRDEGLLNVTDQLTSRTALETLHASLSAGEQGEFEALYEVFGFDKTNFGGELVYSKSLDAQVIWDARQISQ